MITRLFLILYVVLILALCAICAKGEGNAPINYGTQTHQVKKPPSAGNTDCDFNFSGLNVCGLEGLGLGSVTTFSAGNLSPLFTTAVLDPTTTPVLLFNPSNAAAHTYYGNNTGSSAVPGFHQIDFSEIAGTPPATHKVTLVVDGAGGVLTTGAKNPVKILEGGTLQGWLLIAKPSGSVTIDVLRAANNGGIPSVSIIGGGTKPALSSAVENSSTSFSGWTSTTLTAKDNIAISLSGISTVTYCQLTLYYE